MKTNKLSLEAKIMVGGGLICLVLMPFSFFTQDPLKFVFGVIYGGVYSILNFRVMQLNFEKAIKMPSAGAQKYIQARYFLRFLISGVVIYVAVINPWLNIIGVLLGLSAVKISVLINKVLIKENVSGNEA